MAKKVDKVMEAFYNVVKNLGQETEDGFVNFREALNHLPSSVKELVSNPPRAIDHQLRNQWSSYFEKRREGKYLYLKAITPKDNMKNIIETKIEARKSGSSTKKISKRKFSEIQKQIIKTPIPSLIKKADFISVDELSDSEIINILKESITLTLSNVLVRKIVIVQENLEKFTELVNEDLDFVIYWDESSGIEWETFLNTVKDIADKYNMEIEIVK